MPTIETCGPLSKRTNFTYRGSTQTGIVIEFNSGEFKIESRTISSVIEHFRGKTVLGGFSMTAPPEGSVGEFLQQQGHGLTPRHASFLCSVLQYEGLANCTLNGNAVVIEFKA